MSAIGTLIKWEIAGAISRAGGIVYPLLFFIITVSLFPLAIGSETDILQKAGGGIIWVMALLASLLPLPTLFEEDREDGMLEQLLVAGITPPVIVMVKLVAYWLAAAFPLILAAPVLGLMLMLNGQTVMMLLISLLIGTPSLCLISGMSAALMLGAKRNNGLVFLIALPLTVPILIFGAASGGAASFEIGKTALVALCGLLMIIAPISITVCAMGIKER